MTKGKVPPLERRERSAFLPRHNFNEHSLEVNLRESLPAGLSALGIQPLIGPKGFGKNLLRRVKYVIMLDGKPSSGQVFAEVAMFGAVGIGNCDKLFPSMLFPSTCAKTLAEALEHVRRMEDDSEKWRATSEYAKKVMFEKFDLENTRVDLGTVLQDLDCRVRTSDLPAVSKTRESAVADLRTCGAFFMSNSYDHEEYLAFNDTEYTQ
mmetsp:Transcript_14652/g.31406  ORF Transcript_14652/g.31406 Transcript_14652/m.31406 type:complete len:208 (+) Transcript_14652:805-1428(+)